MCGLSETQFLEIVLPVGPLYVSLPSFMLLATLSLLLRNIHIFYNIQHSMGARMAQSV
jgi:hypothetical protein